MIITDRNILTSILKASKTGDRAVAVQPSNGFVELYADAGPYAVSRVINTEVDPNMPAFWISGDALQRLIKAAPKGSEISFEIDSKTTPPTFIAKAGAGRFELPVSPGAPIVDPRIVGDLRDGVAADNPKALRGVILDALPVMSTDDTRALHAIQIDECAKGGVRAIATDGHRVAVIGGASDRVYGGVEPKASAILSGAIAPHIAYDLSRAMTATVESDDRTSRVSIRDEHGYVTYAAGIGRAGKFPQYLNAIPSKDSWARSVRAAAEDLLRAIGEVEPFAHDAGTIQMLPSAAGSEVLDITASSSYGRASSAVPVSDLGPEGPKLGPVGINARYLREAVKAVSGDRGRVRIHLLRSPIDPVTITSEDGKDMVVTMPMRIP